MALKPCRECKSMVSDKAKNCPNCGIRKPVKRSATWIWVAFGIVILFIVISPENDNPIKNTVPKSQNLPAKTASERRLQNTNTTSATSIENTEPNIERALKQVDTAMQDPRKVRLMECIGVNPWKVKPARWVPPTEEECNQLKQVLGAEADAREKSTQNN